MSAFIVDREYIDHMVTAAIHCEQITTTPDEAGRMLWRECLISVAVCYPNDVDGDRPGPCDFRDSDVLTYTWTDRPLLTVEGIDEVIRCYRYQSCEHAAWEGSQAEVLTAKLLTCVNSGHWSGTAELGERW
jgi:hypothetical protein